MPATEIETTPTADRAHHTVVTLGSQPSRGVVRNRQAASEFGRAMEDTLRRMLRDGAIDPEAADPLAALADYHVRFTSLSSHFVHRRSLRIEFIPNALVK